MKLYQKKHGCNCSFRSIDPDIRQALSFLQTESDFQHHCKATHSNRSNLKADRLAIKPTTKILKVDLGTSTMLVSN